MTQAARVCLWFPGYSLLMRDFFRGSKFLRRTVETGKKRIASIGDSHSLFTFAAFPEIDIFWLGPRTMHRVGRDGFRSLLTFRYGFLPWNYARIKDYDFIIMSFGEIDAREHVEKISKKTAKPIEEIVNTLVQNFMESLALFFDGKAKIIISCVHPTPPGYNTGQLLIRDTINQTMESYCAKYNFQFLDFRDQCQTKGWLDNRYAGDGVHLDPRNTEFVKEAILAKLGINLTYAPDYEDLYLRPMSAKTLRAKYNRARKKLFRRN